MSERQHHQEGTRYVSGIDQHKRDCVITTYAADGQRVKQQRVPNDPSRLPRPTPGRGGVHRLLVLARGPATTTSGSSSSSRNCCGRPNQAIISICRIQNPATSARPPNSVRVKHLGSRTLSNHRES
jgi:hypothetical protein